MSREACKEKLNVYRDVGGHVCELPWTALLVLFSGYKRLFVNACFLNYNSIESQPKATPELFVLQ